MSLFMPTPRDADYATIVARVAAGERVSDLWREYAARAPKPYGIGHFLKRLALFRASCIAASSTVRRDGPSRSPPLASYPLERREFRRTIMTGIMHIAEPGVALKVRAGSLFMRAPDGRELLAAPREHRIKIIILAGFGGSVSVEAIRWLQVEHIALLIAHGPVETFSLFSTDPRTDARRSALAARRAQFAAPRTPIARWLLTEKFKTLAPRIGNCAPENLTRLRAAKTIRYPARGLPALAGRGSAAFHSV